MFACIESQSLTVLATVEPQTSTLQALSRKSFLFCMLLRGDQGRQIHEDALVAPEMRDRVQLAHLREPGADGLDELAPRLEALAPARLPLEQRSWLLRDVSTPAMACSSLGKAASVRQRTRL